MKTTLVLAVLVLLAAPLLADATPDGATIFKAKCAMCHGPDGSGQTPMGKSMKIRALGSPDVQKQSDAELINVVTNGKNKMLAYKGKLTPEEIKAVVGHIRTFKK
jgi:mono/diheme cytochrome c family protein